ncbi:MAG: T9SS type A sorting domain-containing protein, partial [Bacteroidia bacterium]|nr:T9SS type A sorting domain-containing protein [Bacteroidia bacterium]
PPRAGDIITTKKSNNNASPGHVAVVKSISPAISPNVSNYTLHVVQQNVGESPGLHLDGQWTLKRRNGKWSVQRPAPNVCLGWIRGIPNPVEPGSVNSVPVINTTTPVFAWARHRNMKSYDVFVFELSGNCYQQISGSPVHVNGNNFAGLSFPALQPGKSYKWYVRNNFFNGSAIRSDAYYFSVAPNAIPTSGNSTVNGIGGNYSYLDIRTIGSQLDDAGVWFKNDSVWTLLGNTHNDGYLEIDQELSILTGDSLRVERKGYSPLTMPVTPEITAGKLYLPMFENVQSPAKLKVVLNNNDLITSSPSVAIHVSGQNFLGYMIGKNGAFFETQVYSPVDTLVNFAPLDTGLNLIDFAYFNATDTFYINKDVYYIPTLSGYTISVTLNNTSSAKGMLLLNGHPFKTITGSTTFTLPAEVYDLTFTGFGYENERFLIEGDTVLSLTAIPRPNFTVSHTLPFSAGDSVKYMGSWMTVKYTGTQSITAMRSPASVPGIFNPVSETFQAVKPIPDNAKLQLEVIIDKSYVPATGFYVLIERNGVSTAYTEAEFGDSIVYEPEYQILKFLKLYGNEKLTLVEPAMPLPVTALMEMNAEPMDNRWILLNWLVQDSDNLSHFVVQRSLDGSQGFAGIGQVPCPPNHDIATPFVYEDYSVIPEVTYYYRVITTNVFGEMEYSPVVSARLSASKAGFVSVYPNPVKDWMTIQLHQPVSGSIYAEVVNELGQVLMKPVFVSPDNRPAFSLNVEKLPPSVYIIRIKDENGGVFSEKFVKQ